MEVSHKSCQSYELQMPYILCSISKDIDSDQAVIFAYWDYYYRLLTSLLHPCTFHSSFILYHANLILSFLGLKKKKNISIVAHISLIMLKFLKIACKDVNHYISVYIVHIIIHYSFILPWPDMASVPFWVSGILLRHVCPCLPFGSHTCYSLMTV